MAKKPPGGHPSRESVDPESRSRLEAEGKPVMVKRVRVCYVFIAKYRVFLKLPQTYITIENPFDRTLFQLELNRLR